MRRFLAGGIATFLLTTMLTLSASAAAPADAEGAAFTATSPVRVLDTRNGTGGVLGAVGPGATISVDLSSNVPASATAVVLNVTGTEPTAPTFITVFPHGVTRPVASNLNLLAGETKPNLVTVAVGSNRRVDLFNFRGATHLVADLAGYYAPDGVAKFTSLSPTRVLDTRTGLGGPPTPGPGGTVTLDLSTKVPASATAVVLNVTGAEPTASTFVTVYPHGETRPTASNLNLVAGEIRPNLVTVRLGTDRQIDFFNKAGTTPLIADLAGFYTPDYGAVFTTISPQRVLDTRNGSGAPKAPVGPDQRIKLELGLTLPSATSGLVLNLTGTNPTSSTFVSAFPLFDIRPNASNLNLVTGQTAANLAVVAVGPLVTIELYNRNGSVDLIGDLAGYFSLPDAPCTTDCVFAWGSNVRGQLGTGSTSTASAGPWTVYGLSGVTSVSSGLLGHTGYAVRSDGTVVAWGNNESGQLGNGWVGGKSFIPIPVIGLTGVSAVAGATDGALALREDGTVWAWGELTGGPPSPVPVPVPDLTGVKAIAGGKRTGYALKGDGTVWSWGDNSLGELGTGSPDSHSSVPLMVMGGVRDIAGGGSGAYALKEDGTVWSWGANFSGRLGNGTPCQGSCQSRVPVAVSGLTDVTVIAGDGVHGFAVRSDGTAWAWGSNLFGGLGNGVDCGTCSSTVPVQVVGLTDVETITGFGEGGYAMRTDRTLWGWGLNNVGQLAGADMPPGATYSTRPLPLPDPNAVNAVVGGGAAGFAIKSSPF